MQTDNHKTEGAAPVGSSAVLGGKSCAWSATPITGKIMARPDCSCYWECDAGKIRECEPTNPPLTLGQLMALESQWSPHGIGKGGSRSRECLEAIAIRENALYAQHQKTLNQMMCRAGFERYLADQPILHCVRFGTALICRRIVSRLLGSLRDILQGFVSYRGVALPPNN